MDLAQLLIVGFFLLVLVGGGFLFDLFFRVFLLARQRNKALMEDGVDVEAEVIDREQRLVRDGTLFFITYCFRAPTAEGEQEFTATEQVWLTEYDNYQPGAKVWVTYLPSNPNVVLRSSKVVGRT